MLKTIKDLSVVQLKDGREATVVHVYPESAIYCVEIEDDTHDLVDVTIDEIASLVYEPPQ